MVELLTGRRLSGEMRYAECASSTKEFHGALHSFSLREEFSKRNNVYKKMM